eukprot:771318-Rhodomonas_salina.2
MLRLAALRRCGRRKLVGGIPRCTSITISNTAVYHDHDDPVAARFKCQVGSQGLGLVTYNCVPGGAGIPTRCENRNHRQGINGRAQRTVRITAALTAAGPWSGSSRPHPSNRLSSACTRCTIAPGNEFESARAGLELRLTGALPAAGTLCPTSVRTYATTSTSTNTTSTPSTTCTRQAHVDSIHRDSGAELPTFCTTGSTWSGSSCSGNSVVHD